MVTVAATGVAVTSAKCSLSRWSVAVSLLVGEETCQKAAYRDARRIFDRAYQIRKKARRAARWSGASRNNETEATFCIARRNIMQAIQRLEEQDAAALIQKARYMSLARLPSELKFDEVLYYLDGRRKIHLFYGGHQSPDGYGHGHVVLTKRGEKYTVVYRREPFR
jgi:hypothetical protein